MENIRLKNKRLEKKLSQEKLAHLVGIVTGTYRNVEKGKNEPSVETAKKLQKF